MSWENFADVPRPDRIPTAGYRLVWGKHSTPVERMWTEGLSIKVGGEQSVPGLAELYDGDRHIASVLLCSDAVEAGEHRFRFKRLTRHADAPPRDYAPEPEPATLLPSPDRARPGL